MMVEYWVAGKLGQVWLHVHGSLRPEIGDLPGECARVARGEQLPAGRLWLAQDFAVRVWWRFGMAMCLLCFPFGFALGLFSSVHIVATALTAVFAVLVCCILISAAQGAMLRYRSDQNKLAWTVTGPSAEQEPLPQWSDGLPRKTDFWVIMVVVGMIGLILFYVGTSSLRK